MRRIELEDPYSLLDLLFWQRPLQHLIEHSIRLELTNIESIEKELYKVCWKAGVKYALTAFSGLMHYLPYYLTFPVVHIYTDDPDKLSKMLQRGRGPITLEVLRPDFNWILEDSVKVGELSVVDEVQVVIDLFCLGSAGRDAATQLYERIGNEQNRTQ